MDRSLFLDHKDRSKNRNWSLIDLRDIVVIPDSVNGRNAMAFAANLCIDMASDMAQDVTGHSLTGCKNARFNPRAKRTHWSFSFCAASFRATVVEFRAIWVNFVLPIKGDFWCVRCDVLTMILSSGACGKIKGSTEILGIDPFWSFNCFPILYIK